MKKKKRKTAGILLASLVMLFSVANGNPGQGSKDLNGNPIPSEGSNVSTEITSE
jgi:hypothetical protein